MNRLRGAMGVAGVTVLLTLAAPSGAPAAEVIGQTGNTETCGNDTAFVQTVISGLKSYSPSSYGVITSWSAANQGTAGRSLQLLVLAPNPASGPDHFIAVQKDQVRQLTILSNINTFTGLRLPIEPTERLGHYVPPGQPGGVSICAFSAAGSTINASGGDPPLGMSVDYATPNPGFALNAQAVVEPDTDRDVFGDESQDNCVGTKGTVNGCPNTVTLGKATPKGKTVTVMATVPGAGTLTAGSADDKTLALTAKKKKKKSPPTLTKSSQTLTAKTTQTVALTLNLSKAGKSKLARKGKLGLSIKVTYTPIGGIAGIATTSAKLNGKKKKKKS